MLDDIARPQLVQAPLLGVFRLARILLGAPILAPLPARRALTARRRKESGQRKPEARDAAEQQYRQKLAIEFASGKPSFDACYVAQATQKRLFGKGKWLADLRPLIADPSLTAPDFDFADFSKASIEAGTQADGRVDTLPMTFHYNILMYNKELFAKKGLAVPANFAQLMEAAAKLNDPANGVSGFVARGLKNANTPIWTSFMLGYGVDAIGKDGRLYTDEIGRAHV